MASSLLGSVLHLADATTAILFRRYPSSNHGKLDGGDYPWLSSERIPQLHKGKLCWWHTMDNSLVFDSFDMSTEEFQRVDVRFPKIMGTISECLLNEESMVVLGYVYDKSWEIWALLKYWDSESWTKLVVIDLEPPLGLEIVKDNVTYTLGNIIKSAGFSRNLKCFFKANLMSDQREYLEEEAVDKSQGFVVFHLEMGKFSHLELQGETLLNVVTNYVPSQVSPQNFI